MKLVLPIASSILALSLVTSASAAPLLVQDGRATQSEHSVTGATVTPVGWRHRHHNGWHGHDGRRGHRYGWGPAIGGLAAGALIGSAAIASSHAQASADAYCEQKYRSYDPASGTYLGYDGQRHACP
jgi:hypothetical protein